MPYEELRDEILGKKPVIHTRFAEQLITEPHEVEGAYNRHYHTHVALGDTSDFARKLAERIIAAKTSTGAVVAPWGYGKTSTLIYTWRRCEEAQILAVPPFICSSLQDILNATYGWLRFRLGRSYHDELKSSFDQYGRAAFDERVKAYAAQSGVAEADTGIVLRAAMADGFVPELTATNLMTFLAYGASLAKRAGYNGLAILTDELQHFFGKSADVRGTIQKLRDIIWWMAAHGNLSLGLILCMPADIESVVQEENPDVLDRLKVDRLYVSLRNIYTPEFPRELWRRYLDTYEAGPEGARVLDEPALTSIGQIAAREDLGRGPRTVVDILQCALRYHERTNETYTAITLTDDFLTSQISFDMQTNPMRVAVEDAFSVLGSRIASEAHRNAVKLWAAFPEHGCPDQVLDAYGAKQAANELSEMPGVHGALITYQTVGYTLRKLASFTPGGTAAERIARDLWQNYRERDPVWTEAAQKAFVDHILPRIFEKRSQAWGRWELDPTTDNGYSGRLTGSFSDQYPDRLLDVKVATEPGRIEPRHVDARSDFQFDFVLRSRQGRDYTRDPGRIELVDDSPRWIRFDLNLDNHALAGASMPQDLRNLKSSLNPNFLTPQLMLAFVDYVGRWERIRPDNKILESESGPISTLVESMLNYAVRVLFSDELKATFEQKLDFCGLQIVREIFTWACQTAWPPEQYHTLLTVNDRALRDYSDALTKLPAREKRGDMPLTERQKRNLARLFGAGTHTALETRAKNDYADLMRYHDLGGDQAEVQLRLHPLEQAIMQEMTASQTKYRVSDREVPALPGSTVLNLGAPLGYRDPELAIALQLLMDRELVGKDDTAELVYCIPSGPSVQEVGRRLEALQQSVNSLPLGLVSQQEKEALFRGVGAILDRFSPTLEEEQLEEVDLGIGRAEKDYEALVDRKRQALVAELAEQVQVTEERIGFLKRPAELDEDVPAGLDFRRHLIDLQDSLRRKTKKLSGDLSALLDQLKALHTRIAGKTGASEVPKCYAEHLDATAHLTRLGVQFEQLTKERKGLAAWFRLLKESELLYKSLGAMPDLQSRLIAEVVPEINRNFTFRGLDALAEDEEQFRLQFDEIARERNTRIAAGNEVFGIEKERCRAWLAGIGVQRSEFMARYSPAEHDESYQDMYTQVKALAMAHLDGLSELLRSLDLGVRKARLIREQKLTADELATLKASDRQQSELRNTLEAERKWIAAADLTQADDLAEHGARIISIGRTLGELDGVINDLILHPIEPQTEQELKVISLLGSRREADLTELVVDAENELDLMGFVTGLVGLYQGNQVGIKVQKRG